MDYVKMSKLNKILFFTGGLLSGYALNCVVHYKHILTLWHKNKSSLCKISKRIYQLTYVHRGQEYKLRFPIIKGPKRIKCILDEHEYDVTEGITPYMGINQDFHRQRVSPKDFGYVVLYIHTSDGKVLKFEQEDIIEM